ncbi:hypothetical protein AB0L63_04235 [Nocardia sp. NPDC051990]|uniref:hypothetical protein n=1 Tax=Nocardia sp. NPDC051990 TaxID=3155285 RepID=UPI00343A6475
MFSIAALVPSPPILVPELCGAVVRAAESDSDDAPAVLRAAALAAVGALAATTRHWTVVGVGAAAQAVGSDAVGTFRGFGANVQVGLSEDALSRSRHTPGAADPQQPLPALIAGWLRGQVAPEAVAATTLVAADTPADECARIGAQLRTALDDAPQRAGVLVVADGAATLTRKAPGYLDERAVDVQRELDRALAEGDTAGLLALDPALCAELGLSGRAAYQVLAGLFAADPIAPSVETLYSDAPFGVGYHVSVWRPSAPGGDR